MRILYLADIRFPLERANGIQSMETCHALAARGHQVRLTVRSDTAVPARDPLAFYDLPPLKNLRIDTVPTAGPMMLRRVLYSAGAVLGALVLRPDVILTRDLGVAATILWLPRGIRPPVVYESHGFAPVVAASLHELLATAPPSSPGRRHRLLRREQRIWAKADGYVTITDALGRELRDRFGARGTVATVADGVRLPADRRFMPSARSLRPLVAYGGHLYPWKGVDVLLRALALLPGADGLIAGGLDGEPDLARTKALATSLGIAARVRFTGFVGRQQITEMLAHADVLVLPNTQTTISASYTSPLKLFEYLAAGRPIVASDLPSVREVLRPDENAVLVTPSDPDALAAGISRVLQDEALAARIAMQAFQDAVGFSWAARAEKLERVLEAAVDL